MIRKLIIPLLALATLTGCTQSQIAGWLQWYETDPEAATEFANQPEIQAALRETSSGGYQPGNCDSYVPLFQKYGLPAATFKRIAWRESGCNHRSYVHNATDIGGGLLGINLRAGARTWYSWCGLTTSNVTNADKNVECASEAYQRMGMAPWT